MQLLPFMLSLALVVLLASWMFVSSRVHYLIKMVCAVVVVAWALALWPLSTELLGYPIDDVPPNNSIIVGLILDQPGNHIYLWIATRSGPRSYALPYDETIARLLGEAQARARAGNGLLIWHIGPTNHGIGSGRTGIHSDSNIPGVTIDVVPVLPPKDES